MLDKDGKAYESEFMEVDREIDFSFEDELDDEYGEQGEEQGEESEGLVKTTIEEMITPDKIKPVLMDEKTKIDEQAVMIDLTFVSMITEESLKAIKYLVKEEGDMDIILKVGDNRRGIGKGDSNILYELVPQMVEQLYNNEAKVYFKKKDKFLPHSSLDTSIIRLKLF